jgi:hypothetical protein
LTRSGKYLFICMYSWLETNKKFHNACWIWKKNLPGPKNKVSCVHYVNKSLTGKFCCDFWWLICK